MKDRYQLENFCPLDRAREPDRKSFWHSAENRRIDVVGSVGSAKDEDPVRGR